MSSLIESSVSSSPSGKSELLSKASWSFAKEVDDEDDDFVVSDVVAASRVPVTARRMFDVMGVITVACPSITLVTLSSWFLPVVLI